MIVDNTNTLIVENNPFSSSKRISSNCSDVRKPGELPEIPMDVYSSKRSEGILEGISKDVSPSVVVSTIMSISSLNLQELPSPGDQVDKLSGKEGYNCVK